MKNKTPFRREYKVAIYAFLAVIVLNILSFIFILLPTYGEVSRNIGKNNGITGRLFTLDDLANIVQVVNTLLIAITVVAVLVGVYKDVRKPKS
jgi:hypothetical protein